MAYFQKNVNEEENQNQTSNLNTGGGNVYSTSTSEVSSITDNNNTNSNDNSGSSSNWVNLNKYIDSNQGKIGKYVDNIVEPSFSQKDDYQSNLEKSKKDYTTAINKKTADKNQSSNLIKRYTGDSNSINNDEWDLLINTSKGYTGPDQIENTGNDYGYWDLNKQAKEFQNTGNNLNTDVGIQSLMDRNLSTGGKNLNTYLVRASDQGKNKVSDYSNQFSELAKLLDTQTSDLNKARENAVNVAEENKKNYITAKDAAFKAEENRIKKEYENQQAKAEANKNAGVGSVNKNVVLQRYAVNPKDITVSLMNSAYMNGNAGSQLQNELNELAARKMALENGIRSSGSKSDTTFDFGGYGRSADNAQYVQRQQERADSFMRDIDQALRHAGKAPQFDLAINLLADDNAGTPEGYQARMIMQKAIQGDMDYNTAIQQIVDMIPKQYTPSAWDQFKDQTKDIYDTFINPKTTKLNPFNW